MTLWAIVPVKPLRKAKSRLAAVISSDERAELGRKMLMHTLGVIARVPGIGKMMVVSRDSSVISLARDFGATTVSERGRPTLNRALSRATRVALGYGTRAVLVLHSDLPLLQVDEIKAMIALAGKSPVVVIAPDHKGTGTNALLCSPPGVIDYHFGENSFEKHQAAAQAAGARVEICRRPGLGQDVDNPSDLAVLRQALPQWFSDEPITQ